MPIKKTLGGDRLGSGKKMEVELHGYERSTHDLGYLWRSTMSAGTLVPFMKELALPGDTFDINLNTVVLTHPTVGPLFGSYKVQLDVFQAPIRLYQGLLHNNKLGIGLKMSQVPLPQIKLFANQLVPEQVTDADNAQINPSHLLSYLDIRGIGANLTSSDQVSRNFNAVPFLAYWDIYKNYYANKQEEIGAMIFQDNLENNENITSITIDGNTVPTSPTGQISITSAANIQLTFTTPRAETWQIIFDTDAGPKPLSVVGRLMSTVGTSPETYQWKYEITGNITVFGWRYITTTEMPQTAPVVTTFPLSRIDDMREEILRATQEGVTFIVNDHATPGDPYYKILTWTTTVSPYLPTQQGLALKTYQSDLLNNWLSTEWIDGFDGITEITKIDTTGGSFTIDEFQLNKKVYDMLNRIAVSGGSYDDWLDSVYDHPRIMRAETPIYHGGLIKELVFQEVISNAQSGSQAGNPQPLGTLAGRGILSNKHKGGKIVIKVDEPSYIIGIVSITPRIDYSQGNKWDTTLQTMDDLHKPALDEIGFQELIEEQMAWWSTTWDEIGLKWQQKSAGKQPAWINYMTNINTVRGNFAIADNEMFMTLNRQYHFDGGDIGDVTTYIDPIKYNHIFADTSIDAQNFWTQISIDIEARRKLSAKLMPNL